MNGETLLIYVANQCRVCDGAGCRLSGTKPEKAHVCNNCKGTGRISERWITSTEFNQSC